MRIADGFLPGPITPEEIERVKKLRDSGAVPVRQVQPDDGERLTSRELKALYTISGAKLLLASDAMEALTRRFKKLKLWWRYRGALRTLQTCINQVIDSSDREQRRALPLKTVNMIASVHERKREDPQGLTTWVYIKDLNLVVQRVLEDTCDMCVLDKEEAAVCPLQKSLKAMTTLSTLDVSPGRNGCLFRGMTVMNEVEDGE